MMDMGLSIVWPLLKTLEKYRKICVHVHVRIFMHLLIGLCVYSHVSRISTASEMVSQLPGAPGRKSWNCHPAAWLQVHGHDMRQGQNS